MSEGTLTYGAAQARYASDSTEFVSPQRLLVMLYDGLLSDLSAAESAMITQEYETTGKHLGRAQEILLELHSTLDVKAWPEGESLARLYMWMVAELMQARVAQQPARVADCRVLVQPLRDAWFEAALSTLPAEPTGHA